MSSKYIMKMSELYAPTLKEDPTDAELISHKLLLRAGYIRKTAAGLYTYLPLAQRCIKKIEQVVREEMDTHGAQELLMPILGPAELWEESGRYNKYGPELMRIKDRHERDFVLGPTHEEIITDLVRHELNSYKQLPVNLYQIQDKFRDELRPRFGLMRGREFIMKDAYSFDADTDGMQKSYKLMYEAYAKICERLDIKALPVAADSGQIGGDTSIEFMALATSGEAELVWCDCGFAADVEAAKVGVKVSEGPISKSGLAEKISTPDVHTIEELANFSSIDESATRKAIALIDEDGNNVVCILPGDHELNEVKAERIFGEYHLMSDEELELAGLFKGSIGPVNLPKGVKCFCDESLKDSKSWAVGANEDGFHIIGACPSRDFGPDGWVDLVSAKEGDICPKCGLPLKSARGIEMGQVFQLGDKYSKALNATYLSKDGKEEYLQMGCYGIGITRTLAAIVEQHSDEHGIAWPISSAPFQVEVIVLDNKDVEVIKCADDICKEFEDAHVEVLVDERAERPGVKFNEADLIGIPYQVIVGKRGISAGELEVKDRASGERENIAIKDVVASLIAKIK